MIALSYRHPPTPGEVASAKPPLPLLVKTESVSALVFALIKSTRPSPLTSAAVIETGTALHAGRGAEGEGNLGMELGIES